MRYTRITIIAVIGIALIGFAFWQGTKHGSHDQAKMNHDEMHKQHMQDGTAMDEGEIMDQHDVENMPGLVGIDTTDEERIALFELFQNHMALEREVELLPNGIKSTTFTQDDELRAYLMSHVSDMLTRVEEGRDPEVIIQSKTLTPIFIDHEKIETVMEVTDLGVVVTQTSDDPEMVALLQKHAGEIDDMVAEGMHAVHMRMMAEGEPVH